MAKRKIATCLFLSLLSLSSTSLLAQQLGIRVDQPRIRQTLSPGETNTGTIRVENTSGYPLMVTVYLQDWSYDANGKGDKEFFPPGTTPYSCANWIRVSPEKIQIPPRTKQEIRYFMTVPAEAKGSYYAVVFFEGAPIELKPTTGQLTATLTGRVASLFFVDIEGRTERSAILEEIRFSKDHPQAPLEAHFTLRNLGNADLSAEGTFDLLDPQGIVVARGPLPNLYLNQTMAIPSAFSWQGKLLPGEYDLIFTYNLGESAILVKEVKIEVTSTGQVVVNDK